LNKIIQRLGPGLLYAAAAVGISHLVQSTRAGADYSYAMWWIIILVALVKYPGTRFGSDYTIATGRTIIHNYITLGKWMEWFYAGIIVLTMAFVGAALTLVVNGLIQSVFNIEVSDTLVCYGLLIITGVLMITGKYRLLEAITKLIVPIFTVLIVLSTILVFFSPEKPAASFQLPAMDSAFLFYIVAIAGWLLTPMDAGSVLSLWTKAKMEEMDEELTLKQSHFDFNLGYCASLTLALCFMIMGASVIYGSGIETANSSGAFATQVISIFSNSLGNWSYYVVGAIAVLVIYSSLLAVLDGFARNLATITVIIKKDEYNRSYEWCLGIIILSCLMVITFFMRSFTTFIDIAGILTFVLAPMYAILNHRAMFSAEVPSESRPTALMTYWSFTGILVMSVVAGGYIYLRWFV
jgi:Mn2+/Fe2+ NRAMP family transporter